jgi:CrcB protein
MAVHFTASEFAAVGAGAAVGAWLRWGLGLLLNPVMGAIPLGTLTANLVGGLLMGMVLGVLQAAPALSPALKLLLTTGLLGGLTTFSTFSAELVGLLQQGRLGWAAAAAGAHVVGSVVMTLAGLATVVWLRT